MTLLGRLEKRGCVSRRKPGRSYVYRPKASREALRESALEELVERFFDGSSEALLRYLQEPRAKI